MYKIILTKRFHMLFQKIADNDPAICEPRWKILAAPMTIINEMYLDTRPNITKLQDRTLDMFKKAQFCSSWLIIREELTLSLFLDLKKCNIAIKLTIEYLHNLS